MTSLLPTVITSTGKLCNKSASRPSDYRGGIAVLFGQDSSRKAASTLKALLLQGRFPGESPNFYLLSIGIKQHAPEEHFCFFVTVCKRSAIARWHFGGGIHG